MALVILCSRSQFFRSWYFVCHKTGMGEYVWRRSRTVLTNANCDVRAACVSDTP